MAQTRIHPDGLTIHLDDASLRRVRPSARWRRGDDTVEWSPTTLDHLDLDGERYVADDDHLGVAVELEVRARGGAAELVLHLRNTGATAIHLDELAPLHVDAADGLHLGGGPSRWRLWLNGWQSWTTTRVYGATETQPMPRIAQFAKQNLNHPYAGRAGVFRSELVAAIADPGARAAVVVGFVGAARQFGGVDVDVSGGELRLLHAGCDLDGVELLPGATAVSEPLLLLGGADGWALLESWADVAGMLGRARVPERPPSGWCSWYHYYSKVREADVRENLAAIERISAERGDATPFDYVMIDDGHQRHIGDWTTTNRKFPGGMSRLAADIRATGRDAGIWLAPFIADPISRTARAHRDWLLRDGNGKAVSALWNPTWSKTRKMRALDTTHPEVLAWLEDLARTVRHDWGYRILKLDFLYAAALPGRRYDATKTRAEALRMGLDAIRTGAGDDAVLIGCGCPLGPAIGVVDAMRISTDVAPFWRFRFEAPFTKDQSGIGTRIALRNVLTRATMHGRLWANDPDCVMVRTHRTRLSTDEVRTLAMACALTDGMLIDSDQLEKVPADRIDILAEAHALAGGRPRVVDLFDRSIPELVVTERDADRLVGVFNFADASRAAQVDFGELGLLAPGAPALRVTDAASGHELVVDGDVVTLGDLAAHACRVLRVTGTGAPLPS